MQQLIKLTIFSIGLIMISTNLYADFSEVKDKGIIMAEPDKVSKANSHYKRARSLLLTALREFDKGAAVASPEILLDVESWRKKLVDNANDLNIIIDPQPRISSEGVTHDSSIKIFDNRR